MNQQRLQLGQRTITTAGFRRSPPLLAARNPSPDIARPGTLSVGVSRSARVSAQLRDQVRKGDREHLAERKAVPSGGQLVAVQVPKAEGSIPSQRAISAESTGTLRDDPSSTRTRYIPSSDRSAVPTMGRGPCTTSHPRTSPRRRDTRSASRQRSQWLPRLPIECSSWSQRHHKSQSLVCQRV